MRKPDSERFLELQRASTRDVKAVGMVAASTGLEMVEYIRTLEQTSIPRATVAAALRELRASVAADRRVLFAFVLDEIDTTIAALGLGDQGEERKCS